MRAKSAIIIQPQSSRLTVHNVDAFLSLVLQSEVAPGHLITLDLRSLDFMDLFAMIAIAFLCWDCEEIAGQPTKLLLSEEGASSFLPRAGFFSLIPPATRKLTGYPEARIEWLTMYHGNNRGLLEFTSVTSDEAHDSIMSRFIHILYHQLRYKKEDAYHLSIMLSELCNNVRDHNPAGVLGTAAMQVHSTDTGKFVHIVVGDRGQGIRDTLCRNQSHADVTSDCEAIRRSVQFGVSEHDERTRGNGLFHLLRLARQYEGSVHIRSGSGKVYYRPDREEPHVLPVPQLTGTQLVITFPMKIS